ncbi:MAG TPA: M23 family metallopeptidase [Rhizomicrobium sp.]|nr:M23 family metallopeptidase [Rhizomicrobium sp.]
MDRRNVSDYEPRELGWAANAASALSSTDGRWALVSTSVTALIAGSVAWLAAATMPPATSHGFEAGRNPSLLPYELFMRLSSRERAAQASFESLGPIMPVKRHPSSLSLSLDNASSDELTGDSSDYANRGIDTRSITMDRGDTLATALADAGVPMDDAKAVVNALAKVYSPKLLRGGQSFEVTFATGAPQKQAAPVAQITYAPPDGADAETDAVPNPAAEPPVGRLLSISFSPMVEQNITVTRGADGAFTAKSEQLQLVKKMHRAGARIDSSLYLAAMQSGIPADVVVQMIHMFSYEVDFQRDLKPGDRFEVLYNYYYTPDGRAAKQGDIVYAAMHLAGRTVQLYRYEPHDGGGPDFFNAKGQSAKAMLMKTPVDGARISSGFGMRFHPLLGYSRMHKGIDFAVPVGTPVMAAGAGTVEQEGWVNGYGNFMLVDHGNTYSTAYGHLSRFAPGIHKGSHVRQGQVIAYSGNTGMSTGPHLHYEIRINKVQVNPLTVKVASGRMLFGKDLRDFLMERIHVDTELASLPLESRVAETASDLRAAKD